MGRDERVEIPTRTLVESLVRTDLTVDAAELYAVAETLGMSDQQVRLCVKRLVADGRFTQEGRGRRAVLRATAETRRTIEPEIEFVRHMYAQDSGDAPWDGAWHLVAFAVPESARSARDALRDALVRLGGAPLQGGLYVTANAWEELVQAEADRLDIASSVTHLTTTDLNVAGITDPRALAARLWPLDALAAAHQRLAALARTHLTRLESPISPPELLAVAVELAAEFTRAHDPDPLLPPELLPTPWPGTEARALFARCWSALAARPTPSPRLFALYADALPDPASAR